MPTRRDKQDIPTVESADPPEQVNFRTRQAQVKREKMRARLLAATMEVCGGTNRRGAAVIDDVVRVAGVSRGAFYWYFNSLDEAIEALGRQLADEIGAETRALFRDHQSVAMRSALGGQIMFSRARMDRVWARYLSNVHVLLDDSAFVTGVRRNLEIGLREGLFRFKSMRMAVDYQIGAVMGAIRRCTFDPPPPLAELAEVNRLVLVGLGADQALAATAASEAFAIMQELGPEQISWWRDVDAEDTTSPS